MKNKEALPAVAMMN